MKKILSTVMCLGVALLALTSCDDKTEIKVIDSPTVTISASAVTLSAEAVNSYTINYTVTNPQDGASVYATANVSWLTILDTSVSGQIRVSVTENTSGNMRTGNVTLTYSYDGGVLTAKAAVVQYGVGDPVLSVDPNAIVANASGGDYSFSYAIENPIDGEDVYCTTSDTWISGFVYSTYGKVSFTVASYTGKELRTGTITVSYAGLSKQVTVVQDHPATGGSGGSSGDVTGTYTAKGVVNGQGYSLQEVSWQVKIYPYEGNYATGSYDYWMDGIVPYLAGFYDTYGDHRASAGIRVSGTTIRVPTQFGNTVLNGDSAYYYLMYTPCVEYNGTSYYYDQSWPDLTFTYNESTGVWTSDYGMFMAGDNSNTAFNFDGYFQVVIPVITLTKTSDTTSLSVDDNRVVESITDLELNFNVMAK